MDTNIYNRQATFLAIMASRKHNRSPSVTSERSMSSLSDTVIRAGRKAKQKALKTVKSFTALLKKPRKTHVVSDDDRKFSIHSQYQNFNSLLADTQPSAQAGNKASGTRSSAHSSMVDVNATSSRASSMVDINMPLPISSDDEDGEDKIIKETENKISKSSAACQFKDLLQFLSAESLQKRLWRSVVYAFFEERPKVVRRNNKKGVKSTYLAFSCVKCSKTFYRGTGSDSGSTGAMRDHIPQCWGEDIWNNAKDLELDPAKEIIRKSRTMKNIKLTEMLARLPGSKETFSLSPPSREEIRYM
jgi:hypothetical protein